MNSKNHIKNSETLRGIGKLGWTESSKLHSTLKRIVVDDEVKTPTNKTHRNTVICPVCRHKFQINGKNVPDHKSRRFFAFTKNVCEGSSSKLIPEMEETFCNTKEGYCLPLDKEVFYIDENGKEFQTKIERIVSRLVYNENGQLERWRNRYVKFVGINQWIPASDLNKNNIVFNFGPNK